MFIISNVTIAVATANLNLAKCCLLNILISDIYKESDVKLRLILNYLCFRLKKNNYLKQVVKILTNALFTLKKYLELLIY